MKKYQKTITVYELPDCFEVEVHRDEELTSFYISHKAYGIKMHMFGLCDCDTDTEEQMIEANAENYMDVYVTGLIDYNDDEEE